MGHVYFSTAYDALSGWFCISLKCERNWLCGSLRYLISFCWYGIAIQNLYGVSNFKAWKVVNFEIALFKNYYRLISSELSSWELKTTQTHNAFPKHRYSYTGYVTGYFIKQCSDAEMRQQYLVLQILRGALWFVLWFFYNISCFFLILSARWLLLWSNGKWLWSITEP